MILSTLSTKTKVIISVVVVAGAFASGRYSVQKPTIQSTTTITEAAKTNENMNTHTKTTITETKQPNGTDTTTTVIDQVANDTKQSTDDISSKASFTSTPPKTSTLNISVLGANDFSKGLIAPTYGVSVTKQVWGPLSIGGFGLMNGVVGVSVGLSF